MCYNIVILQFRGVVLNINLAKNIENNSFPVIVASQYHEWADEHRDYVSRAKSKPMESAAKAVVRRTADKKFMDELTKTFQEAGIEDAIVVSPYKEGSKNLLARVFAVKVARTFGFDIDADLVQLPTDKKMRSCNKVERLMNSVSFAGTVKTDKPYIITDDNLTTGATAKGLKDYIEDNGGSVIYMVSLTSSDGENVDLSVNKSTVEQLRKSIAQTLHIGEKSVKKLLGQAGIDFNRFTSIQAEYFSSGKGRQELVGLAREIKSGNNPNFGLT